MKKILLSVFALLIVLGGVRLPQITTAQEEVSIFAGNYLVAGDGYTGGLEIAQVEAGFLIYYRTNSTFYGTGLEINGKLAASFTPDANFCGVFAYQVQADGSLIGQWSDQGLSYMGTGSAALSSPGADPLTGIYEVSHTDPSTTYNGTLNITMNGTVYQAVWEYGDTVLEGVGIAYEDVLVFSYGSEECGVSLYVPNADGTFTGLWTYFGDSTVGAETLTPIQLAGLYTINGVRADGSIYTGTMELTQDALYVYQYYTVVDETNFFGTAILRGDSLVIGYGEQGCSVANFSYRPDGMTLDGYWVAVGNFELGVETLTLVDPDTFTYDVLGRFGDAEYERSAILAPVEDIISVTIYTDTTVWAGEGLVLENSLGVVYGTEVAGCGLIVYRVQPDLSLSGIWSYLGTDSGVGSEQAVQQ